ncbi:MAG: hypothetical protein ACOCRA_04680 [Halobacteria archaeon]
MKANVARLAGAFMILSQGAATFVLGVESSVLRVVVAVVFFVAGSAALASRKASVPAGGFAALVAGVWTAYIAYVAGSEAVVYEIPVLALVGAGFLAYSSRSSSQ